jgi:preprotein translocase subunit SecB
MPTTQWLLEMDVKQQVKLNFGGVNIVNVRFTSEQPLLPGSEKEIDVIINPKSFYPKDSTQEFFITMEVILKAENYFSLEVFAIGNFRINTNVSEEIKTGFINLNAPSIMFPYLRSFISTFTSSLGAATGTLTIPPHFFTGKLEEHNRDDFNIIKGEEEE